MKPAQPASLDQLRGAIRSAALRDEGRSVQLLVREAKGTLGQAARREALERARALVERCRAAGHRTGTLDAFLLEFGLSNDEGVTLLCLAEALLRIPDERTADALIAEKVRSGDWSAHIGHSHSLFVNVSVWGLMLTGRLVAPPADARANPQAWLRRLASRLGEPVVRGAVAQAMRILGGQYVLGRTLDEALRRGRSLAEEPVSGFSYDMLGEAARTYADAERYFQAYADAIETLGQAEPSASPEAAEGVSVKLSALHPRFEQRQRRRALGELAPKLKALALQARRHGLQFTLDAEEAARLELNLDLFEGLAQDPDLADWPGLGFVLQAYQKRAPLGGRLVGGVGGAHRAPIRGAAGQGRLLGYGGQAGPGTGIGRLSGLHPQSPHRSLLRSVRGPPAGRAGSDLPAIRNPQRAYPEHGPATGAARRGL